MLIGLSGLSLISYLRIRQLMDREISRTTLPLTTDAVLAGLQHDLLQPVLAASLMARNTLLLEKLGSGGLQAAELRAYLSSVQQRTRASTAFLVTESSGEYHHSSGVLKRVSPQDPQDRWYYRFRASGRPYEINIDRDTADPSRTTAFINVRLQDPAGRFLGATGLGLDLQALESQLRSYGERYGSRILLLNSSGRILLSSDRSSGQLGDADGLASQRARILATPATNLIVMRAGERIHLTSRRLQQLDWVLLVALPSSQERRRLLELLAQNLLAAVAISTILLVLAHLTLGSQHRQLERLASTDKLTGLLNRAVFDPFLSKMVALCRRRREPLALALLDLDHFKGVNDRFGHLLGDRMIVHVSQRITGRIREADLLFRWGGEEFLLLLPGCNLAQARQRLEAIQEDLRQHPLALDEDTEAANQLAITLSAGVALHQPDETSQELLQRVDERLYEAKRAGRDCICTGEDPLPSIPATV